MRVQASNRGSPLLRFIVSGEQVGIPTSVAVARPRSTQETRARSGRWMMLVGAHSAPTASANKRAFALTFALAVTPSTRASIGHDELRRMRRDKGYEALGSGEVG